jgi:transcriptional regulator with XRE-family HTH domain
VGGEGVRVFDPAALVQARRAVGWTQAQLADAVGAYKANVAAWETGRVRPSPGTVARIATTLGVDPFRLTIGVRTPPLLADLRERRGWSQVELAGRIGVPRSSYSLLERGGLVLRGEVRAALAEALDITEEDISAAYDRSVATSRRRA